jgi:8-oxo-dGTP pyrophosphatase MutT (NUDIX family)
MADRAAAVAAGVQDAVAIGPAATVVLVRPAMGGGIEVYLQRRHRSLAFAGGMFAFPGGRVDPADAALDHSAWSGPPPAVWAERFGADAATARGHVVAVVRELFEETGVLLAVPAASSGTGGDASATWPGEADRKAVSEGRPLAQMLTEHTLCVDSGSLVAWSRWVTPRFERRRFDAWFFVAALPADQEPRVATGESQSGLWVRPDDGLAAMRSGDLAMLPPTWWTLAELSGVDDIADVVATAPPMVRHTVGWAREGDDAVMVLPDDARYPGDDPREGS